MSRRVFSVLVVVSSVLLLFCGQAQCHRLETHLRRRISGEGELGGSKRYEGSSDLVHMRYHMGPVLSSPIRIYLIWYGRWRPAEQSIIRDFLRSISDASSVSPSVREWWSTAALYRDQTGANVTRSVSIAGETSDPLCSRGSSLTRLDIQRVIADAVAGRREVGRGSGSVVYLVLTDAEVTVQDFCRAVCGFHYFTFPSIVGRTLPYAWVGNSGVQCPAMCAYPFVVPEYMVGTAAMAPPNGDAGVDGMVSVIGHELAELSSDPLVNSWYAGEDPTAPTEIADLCEGIYGTGGGGGYAGQVMADGAGRKYNVNGRAGRRFLVQWLWSPVLNACAGPNAID